MSANLLRSQRRAVKIKRQLIRPDRRTFLRRFFADDFVQCPMEQMRDSVVPLDGGAAGYSRRSESHLRANCGSITAFHKMQAKCCRFFAC